MASLPRFDFSLNLDLIGEVPASETGPKSAKDKDAKRLARCGKCNNCKSQDCGTCYNCADKPKFGGPGIKKQACINRKCLLMVPRDEEGEKIARKRAKQRTPMAGVDPRVGGAGKPYALPTGFGAQRSSYTSSPPSSPDVDSRSDRDSSVSPVSDDRDSPVTTQSTTKPANFASAANFSYGQMAYAPNSTRLDPVEPVTTGLSQAQTGLTPYFSAGMSSAADELPALFGDSVSFMLPTRREPSEFPRLFEEKLNAPPAQRDAHRDWSWTNPMLLQEEFILMNDLHRRESARAGESISVM